MIPPDLPPSLFLSFYVFPLAKPLLVGEEINSRLVCRRLQEFVIVSVECTLYAHSASVWLFSVGGRMRLSHVQGRWGRESTKILTPLSLGFPSPQHLFCFLYLSPLPVVFLLFPVHSFSSSCKEVCK